MSRRYLSIEEAESALKRGKNIELFIGGFNYKSKLCIRWLSLQYCTDGVLAKLWESVDEGSVDYCDIYSFTPLSGEWDTPFKLTVANNISAVMEKLAISELKFVNEGVVQDEYADYKLKNT